MAPTPHHPLHLAGACTDATAHPQHGHHRTTSCTTCNVRSQGTCTPQPQARCPDTTALDRLPLFPSQHLCGHSTRVGRLTRNVKAHVRFRVNQDSGQEKEVERMTYPRAEPRSEPGRCLNAIRRNATADRGIVCRMHRTVCSSGQLFSQFPPTVRSKLSRTISHG